MAKNIQLKENLARLMAEQRLTLAKLAHKSGVPKSSIHGWLTSPNQEKVNLRQLKKVCDALKVEMHVLLFSTSDPNATQAISEEILIPLFRGDVRITIEKIERKGK